MSSMTLVALWDDLHWLADAPTTVTIWQNSSKECVSRSWEEKRVYKSKFGFYIKKKCVGGWVGEGGDLISFIFITRFILCLLFFFFSLLTSLTSFNAAHPRSSLSAYFLDGYYWCVGFIASSLYRRWSYKFTPLVVSFLSAWTYNLEMLRVKI